MAGEKEHGQLDFDVVIIGAGIAGINAGYRLQTQCPELSYTILERREDIGGTWAFFKYPGIRSDSDLYSFGFEFDPWHKPNPIADADSICAYVRATARKYDIDKRIQFYQDVQALDWRSKKQHWIIQAQATNTGRSTQLRARFVIAGTGFFNYREARETKIPGLDNFQGEIIHPQFWPKDYDYSNKKMVVIGSGATAITIVPAVADKVEKVVMIQRSPGYILSLAMKSSLDDRIRSTFSWPWAGAILRWKAAILAWAFFYFCVYFPNAARNAIGKAMQKELPKGMLLEPHFKPAYNVWDQRVCVCPDGDFYKSLESGKAEVVTGAIRTVTNRSIIMESGEQIEADVIVTATGLKLQMLGGAQLSIDGGKPFEVGDCYMWRGTMLENVPNAMVVIGYWNNSWTLGADLSTQIFISVIKKMKAKHMTSVTPRLGPKSSDFVDKPLWNMSSTYLVAGNQTYPKASNQSPWNQKDNYFRDVLALKTGRLSKGLEFSR